MNSVRSKALNLVTDYALWYAYNFKEKVQPLVLMDLIQLEHKFFLLLEKLKQTEILMVVLHGSLVDEFQLICNQE